LKISEIASYLRATDERIAILFGSQPTIAERIKAHVIGLRREIGKFAEMAAPLPLTLQSIKAKNPVKKRTSDGPSQFLT